MPDIVISEFMNEDAVRALAADFDVHYDPGLVDRPEALARLAAGCRALVVRNRTQVRGALLEAAAELRVVGRLGVGLDNIDLDACEARGIRVFPATGANVLSVAEYVIAGVLMLLRGAYGATPSVLAGEWPRNRLMGREASGRTLGLVGFGAIARAVVPRAAALGMHVIAHDPLISDDAPVWSDYPAAPRDLDRLLAQADAVSLHVPLTDATRKLLDAGRIARMKPGAVLINTARGGVVDEAALASALRDGHLSGAMLDVFEHEPLPAGSALAGVPNLVLTPHIAGITEESDVRVGELTARNVREAMRALP